RLPRSDERLHRHHAFSSASGQTCGHPPVAGRRWRAGAAGQCIRVSAAMIRSARKRQGGFTLMEMLIAMAVFAVMSMVAYQGLRAVLDADHITREQAQRLADLQVTLSVLERDLAQVVDVRVRDEFGDPLPPLR